MKRINKLSLTFSFLSVSLFVPAVAFAGSQSIGTICSGGAASFGGLCIDSSKMGALVNNVVNLLFLAAALISLVYLVLGGIKWVTSEGDSKNVEAARNQIIAAAIGLGLTFLSYLIINVLLTFFGIKGGFGGLTLPTISGS